MERVVTLVVRQPLLANHLCTPKRKSPSFLPSFFPSLFVTPQSPQYQKFGDDLKQISRQPSDSFSLYTIKEPVSRIYYPLVTAMKGLRRSCWHIRLFRCAPRPLGIPLAETGDKKEKKPQEGVVVRRKQSGRQRGEGGGEVSNPPC